MDIENLAMIAILLDKEELKKQGKNRKNVFGPTTYGKLRNMDGIFCVPTLFLMD